MKCKYPDKPCSDRYLQSRSCNLMCRLQEWKNKFGVCPYNKDIKSKAKIKKKEIEKGQRTLT